MSGVIHFLKILWERKNFALVGRNVLVHYSAALHGDHSIALEDEVVISRGVSISGRVRLGARTVVLDYSLLHTWGGEQGPLTRNARDRESWLRPLRKSPGAVKIRS